MNITLSYMRITCTYIEITSKKTSYIGITDVIHVTKVISNLLNYASIRTL